MQTEQEHRRALEAELRRVKQNAGPLGRHTNGPSPALTNGAVHA